MITVANMINYTGTLGDLKTKVEALIKLHGEDNEVIIRAIGSSAKVVLKEEGDMEEIKDVNRS